MTDAPGIGNLQQLGVLRRDESKGVCPDISVGHFLLDLRHVTRYALVPNTPGGMMRVSLYCGRMRAVG